MSEISKAEFRRIETPADLTLADLGKHIQVDKPWGCYGQIVALNFDGLGGRRIRTVNETGDTICDHSIPMPQNDNNTDEETQ